MFVNFKNSILNTFKLFFLSDPLNETQLLDSDFHANFAENYSSTSFRKANDQSNLTAKKRNVRNFIKIELLTNRFLKMI